MKRYRLRMEDATCVLNYRETINRALRALQALRFSARTQSRRRFVLEMKKTDPLFDPDEMHRMARRGLQELVFDLDVMEHQGIFETLKIHSINVPPRLNALPNSPDEALHEASDVLMARHYCTREL